MTVTLPWRTEPAEEHAFGAGAVELYRAGRFITVIHRRGTFGGWWMSHGDLYPTRDQAIAACVARWDASIAANQAAGRDPFYVQPSVITRQNWERRP